ncbi:MAG: peptidoglycan-binding domain-containing protein [Burkholderiales bacterium]
MTMRWVRLGFGIFLMLCMAFAGNLFLLQPASKSSIATKTPVGPGFGRETGEGPVTGTIVLNAPVRDAKSAPQGTVAGQTPTKISEAINAAKIFGNDSEVVRAVQRELQTRGYEVGSPDGMPGLITRAAIMAYEADRGLALTAEPSEPILQHILLGASKEHAKTAVPAPAPGPEAERVIRTVQQSLANLGYGLKSVDGRLGDQTSRSIREFEAHYGLQQTGRISGQLVARLARLAGQGRIADSR